MKSCVTISLVDEAKGGPFVFWDGLEDGCRQAAELGFDAVEVFPPGPEAVDPEQLKALLSQNNLLLAAVGTGAGWVKHRLSLTAADEGQRQQAVAFVKSIIDLAGQFHASAIIGSMQGRFGEGTDKSTALNYLANALGELGEYAKPYQAPLIYEPLNRYETNLCNTMQDGVELLGHVDSDNVVLLADLFHMNIEETSVAQGILDGGSKIGHVHFVDSNRQPVGAGHTDFAAVTEALRKIGYDGILSAEAFPIPDSRTAAQKTIQGFRQYIQA
ncbi:MAG: sugar phosphate isomerase/epimerase [Planctomycetales bacterium]|nr:sugar phosphate isomerase/epimerase [Planctomycetales bacterium]